MSCDRYVEIRDHSEGGSLVLTGILGGVLSLGAMGPLVEGRIWSFFLSPRQPLVSSNPVTAGVEADAS